MSLARNQLFLVTAGGTCSVWHSATVSSRVGLGALDHKPEQGAPRLICKAALQMLGHLSSIAAVTTQPEQVRALCAGADNNSPQLHLIPSRDVTGTIQRLFKQDGERAV